MNCPNSNGLEFEIGKREKHQALIRVVCAPRVFTNKKLLSAVVVRQAHDGHAMVVGCAECLKLFLPPLLRNSGIPVLDNSPTAMEKEARLADISLPTHGMTRAKRTLDKVCERVDRQIEKRVLTVIVGHFECKPLVERVVRKAGQCLILVSTANAAGKFLRRIGGTQHELRHERPSRWAMARRQTFCILRPKTLNTSARGTE